MADEVTSVEEDQAARAARIARLRELKEHADACGLPLVYTIEHEGPNGGKQDGLMTAGSGRLQLAPVRRPCWRAHWVASTRSRRRG